MSTPADDDFLTQSMLDGTTIVLDVDAKAYYLLEPEQAGVWGKTMDRRSFLAGLVAVPMATEIMLSKCDRIPPEQRPDVCFNQ